MKNHLLTLAVLFTALLGVKAQTIPAGSQSVENMGRMLYSDYQRFKQENQIDRAYEAIMTRAELDTTNADWQYDVLQFFMEVNAVSPVADRIASRYIRLVEQNASNPADINVIAAYSIEAGIHFLRGEQGIADMRRSCDKALELALSSDKTPADILSNCYHMKSLSYMYTEDFPHMYEYAKKAADILATVPDAPSIQNAKTQFSVALALYNMNKNAECIEILKRVAPLFVDSLGNQMPKVSEEIYPMLFTSYGSLFDANPEDKNLQEEYKEFISDKLLRADIYAENPWGLNGSYYIMERNEWNIECPYAFSGYGGYKRAIFLQDDKLIEIDNPEGKKLNAQMRVETLDKDRRQHILNIWKKNRK